MIQKLNAACERIEQMMQTAGRGASATYLMQRWRAETAPEERAGVKRKSSLMVFLQREHAQIQSQRALVLETEQEQYADSTYESFDVICIREGNNEAAVVAARKYCDKCLTMRGRWCRYNTWTERLEYLYTKIGCKEAFKRRFTHTYCGDDALKLTGAASSNQVLRSLKEE